jgi:hypothetical protein
MLCVALQTQWQGHHQQVCLQALHCKRESPSAVCRKNGGGPVVHVVFVSLPVPLCRCVFAGGVVWCVTAYSVVLKPSSAHVEGLSCQVAFLSASTTRQAPASVPLGLALQG